jgi:hypothetical protein
MIDRQEVKEQILERITYCLGFGAKAKLENLINASDEAMGVLICCLDRYDRHRLKTYETSSDENTREVLENIRKELFDLSFDVEYICTDDKQSIRVFDHIGNNGGSFAFTLSESFCYVINKYKCFLGLGD